jgi:hypothetical protein
MRSARSASFAVTSFRSTTEPSLRHASQPGLLHALVPGAIRLERGQRSCTEEAAHSTLALVYDDSAANDGIQQRDGGARQLDDVGFAPGRFGDGSGDCQWVDVSQDGHIDVGGLANAILGDRTDIAVRLSVRRCLESGGNDSPADMRSGILDLLACAFDMRRFALDMTTLACDPKTFIRD